MNDTTRSLKHSRWATYAAMYYGNYGANRLAISRAPLRSQAHQVTGQVIHECCDESKGLFKRQSMVSSGPDFQRVRASEGITIEPRGSLLSGRIISASRSDIRFRMWVLRPCLLSPFPFSSPSYTNKMSSNSPPLRHFIFVRDGVKLRDKLQFQSKQQKSNKRTVPLHQGQTYRLVSLYNFCR